MLASSEAKKALYQELSELFVETEIIDTHEHLPQEKARVSQAVTFTDLFRHYCQDDFIAAGMDEDDMGKMYDNKTCLEEKWLLFEPYYKLIKNGSYQRAGQIAMEKFYGMREITSLRDAEDVTKRMSDANKPGLYGKVLKDTCRIKKVMMFANEEYEGDLYGLVWNMEWFTEINSTEALYYSRKALNGVHSRFSDYLGALGSYVKRLKEERRVSGMKFALAYKRDLDFSPTTYQEAENVYNRIFTESAGRRPFPLGYNEIRPLQNYLVRELARLAGENDLCMVFHTGIQAGNKNICDNSKPERLWSLFGAYPKTRFVLLHAGLPWTREAVLLAKYFPNVYIDLAWVHIISPIIAVDTIKMYVDLAPMSKLLGFGGDYLVVEAVYGHLMMAKDNIATALAESAANGVMTKHDAHIWLTSMLAKNPSEIYRL